MTPRKQDVWVFSALAVAFAGTVFWAYVSDDLQRLFPARTAEQRAAAQQRALDHLFGSDQAFDPAADNVTSVAENHSDTVTWKMLSHASFQAGKTAGVEFAEEVKQLDGHDITITGYIFPLEAASDQRHFLLSAYPPSCPYCLPGGPTELIEVTGTQPIKFTYEPVTIHGMFELLSGESLQEGMFYRMKR